MISSTSELCFGTLAELSVSFLTKIVSAARRNRILSSKPVDGIAMLSTLVMHLSMLSRWGGGGGKGGGFDCNHRPVVGFFFFTVLRSFLATFY